MLNLFSSKKSKETLKDRLKLVLTYDRIQLAPGKMEELKKELMEVVQRYFPLGSEAVDVQVEQQGKNMRVVADLSVHSTPSQ